MKMSKNKALLDKICDEEGMTLDQLKDKYGVGHHMSLMERERLRKDMTRKELSHRSGVSINTIIAYELSKGLDTANCVNGIRIAKALRKPLDQLVSPELLL